MVNISQGYLDAVVASFMSQIGQMSANAADLNGKLSDAQVENKALLERVADLEKQIEDMKKPVDPPVHGV